MRFDRLASAYLALQGLAGLAWRGALATSERVRNPFGWLMDSTGRLLGLVMMTVATGCTIGAAVVADSTAGVGGIQASAVGESA